MKRTLAIKTIEKVGEEITVKGWVNSTRDHGGLIFVDLRDHSGIVQVTINSEDQEMFKLAESLRDEYVLQASGTMAERGPDLVNPQLPTGKVELVASEIKILNKSDPLPIQINSTQQTGEETRLKYRFLDLRRDKMQQMLKKRAQMYKTIREYMDNREFLEIQTPILSNSSPEGARDFLVPSRLHPGQFYALPQAPQQFKQLLMVGGVPRYYQLAVCFRDEDPRADRLYGEFYQLDVEMSFVEEGEEVLQTVEPLVVDLVENFAGKKLLEEVVPRIPYLESMERFGTDKPDLRFGMELVDLTEELKGCGFGVFSGAIEAGGAVKAIRVEKNFSRSEIDKLTEMAKRSGAGGLPYMMVEGGKAASSITKFFSDEHLTAIVEKTGAKDGDTILFGSDKRGKVNRVLGDLRSHLGDELGLKDPNVVALAWIVDFPLYEVDEDTGELDFGHNPFTMPKGGVEEFDKEDKSTIMADQYDMVMNGYEICSGGVRNHNPEIMYKAFGVLGYDEKYVEDNFSAMLNAFKFGAPPHAGCAFGVDRMLMELVGESNIREVIAFPKNGSGVDAMMQAPNTVEDRQLKELNIEVTEQD